MNKVKHTRLGEWAATAICGNDILSSCLYVSGIAVIFAGIYAPLVLALIAVILYFYKSVYTEVVEALPINGGAYNCLLNGTSKTIAAIAGVTTVLSYVATAVLSGKTGIEYLATIWNTIPGLNLLVHAVSAKGFDPLQLFTIVLMLFFAVLVISGIKDSAKVAMSIFLFHTASLTLFVVLCCIYIFSGHHLFLKENLFHTNEVVFKEGGIWAALFFGFAASLLGVSGFESSANFVEEQQKGVFRKTLRNMLIAVSIFNPLIALLILAVSPLQSIISAKDYLLADESRIVGGNLIHYLIAIDAFFVLSGAVLTSFVGVSGLLYRMSSDACLPGFLTYMNKKGSHPRIIIAFFLLCSSILFLTHGNILSLAGVYTIAFLSVMTLFALGNLILRETRTELKRTYNAPVLFVVIAMTATALGIVGNIRIDYMNFVYFLLYFIPAILLVLAIVFQDINVRILLRLTRFFGPLHRFLEQYFEGITSGTLVAFINHVNRLYPTLEYINRNETVRNIILVHTRNWDKDPDKKRFAQIKEAIPHLQEAGAFPHLNIQLDYEDEPFGPKAIRNAAKKYRIPTNRIMIGSIHHFHEFEYDDLGGVRIIF